MHQSFRQLMPDGLSNAFQRLPSTFRTASPAPAFRTRIFIEVVDRVSIPGQGNPVLFSQSLQSGSEQR